MKISKSEVINGVLVGPKVTQRMGERMGAVPAEDSADPYAISQKQSESNAIAAQTGADDGTGATSTADVTQALANLRHANKNEWQLSFSMLGDLTWTVRTVVYADKTWGSGNNDFSRNYLIDKISHRIARNGEGYRMDVEAHGCLDY